MLSRPFVIWIGCLAAILILAGTLYFASIPELPPTTTSTAAPQAASPRLQSFGNYTLWWDTVPLDVTLQAQQTADASNLRPQDYVGPESCRKCHKKQYEGWSTHSHRWMNARIEDARVVGDFDNRKMAYLGGEVTFYQDDDTYCMRLERGEVTRDYEITQTIGSRFFQYYVGKQKTGPETEDHPLYREDHVLPLGYWISREEWVPVVHVHGEQAEDTRHDPFLARDDWPRSDFAAYAGEAMDLYRSQCNFCHTTFSVGDMLVRHQQLLARHLPTRLDFSLPEYVQASRPELWPEGRDPQELTDGDFAAILKEFRNFDAREHAVTLGVSCEACHLGCSEHARGESKKPQFFPHAPEAVIRSESPEYDLGRTQKNVNWACGRCHAGDRPQLAAGMSTWNSTEYTDAMRGACYSQLTCIKCHNPHQTLGQGWSKTAIEDDAICLSCHQEFEPQSARVAHTRHSMDGEGSRCMNCHMPRLNEGLQEVVRTHMIFSPTNSDMIESDQPNACNLCHVDQSMQWTLGYLEEWHGKSYPQAASQTETSTNDVPATLIWLSSSNEAVRLIAADCLSRAEATWALPELIDALDDPYLLNRQFARIGLERMLGVRLSEFDYHFYQMPSERESSLKQLRQRFLPAEETD